MKLFICDDEVQIRHDFGDIVKRLSPQSEIKVFSSGEQLLNVLGQENCDVLLLDIDMPGISGMDVAKCLVEKEYKPLLVFVTSHDELVYDSFQYHPFGFVRKSFFENEIEMVLKDCARELEGNRRHFVFRVGGRDARLPVSDILFFEADGNYLKLYSTKEEHRIRSTITAVENSLSSCGFIRIHKGFLVNQLAIKAFGTDGLQLENGIILPIGKSYAESAKKLFMRYMR